MGSMFSFGKSKQGARTASDANDPRNQVQRILYVPAQNIVPNTLLCGVLTVQDDPGILRGSARRPRGRKKKGEK